jgi:hypothetical protein
VVRLVIDHLLTNRLTTPTYLFIFFIDIKAYVRTYEFEFASDMPTSWPALHCVVEDKLILKCNVYSVSEMQTRLYFA